MKKILTLFLAIIMIFGAVACTPSNENNNVNNNKPNGSNGTETSTGKYILKNGLTDYKIVMPEENTDVEESACNELVALFFESTGVQLPVIKDTGLSHSDQNKYFSIGNTALLDTANITVPEESAGKDGFLLTTKGETVYFIGGTHHGTLFAVYEFLFRALNFEQFSQDCYSLDKAVVDLELKNYEVVDSPDFPYYQAFTGYMNRDYGVCLRMKAPHQYNLEAITEGSQGHNTLIYIKPSLYNDETKENYHPEWFSYPDQTQLCYIAQGNEESAELLLETFFERMKGFIKEQIHERIIWSISGMDNPSCCNCEACVEYRDKYGCNSAQGIQFINKLYDKVMDWFLNDEEGKQYYREDFAMKISFYEAYVEAPAKLNEETGEYEPIDETVIFRDGIRPSCAPINAKFQYPITHPENTTYYNILKKIDAISSQMGIWYYCTNFHAYLYPFDNYNAMQSTYQTFYEMGVTQLLDETQNGNYDGMTGWHMLQSYLSAQLAWNVYADQEALIDRFFAGYFLDAADDMRRFFESYRAFSQLQMNGLCPGIGNCYYAIGKKEYWPKARIDEWQGYVQSAMEKIERYKTVDPEIYEMLYKHISMERVFLDYVYLQHYKANVGSDFNFYRDRFIADFRLNKITKTKEGNYELEDYAETLLSD